MTYSLDVFAGSGLPGYKDGAGTNASFKCPGALAVDQLTGDVYVADVGNHSIRKITSQGTYLLFISSQTLLTFLQVLFLQLRGRVASVLRTGLALLLRSISRRRLLFGVVLELNYYSCVTATNYGKSQFTMVIYLVSSLFFVLI